MNRKLSLLLLLAVLLLGGYIVYNRFFKPSPQNILANHELPTVQMTLGDQTFTIEIASTSHQMKIGLMHRDSMPQDHGMIFIYPNDQPLNFWMKNTRIPLDILFVDSDETIVSTHTMKPFDESGTSSQGNARWAIEINAGLVSKLGLKKGDKVRIPPKASGPISLANHDLPTVAMNIAEKPFILEVANTEIQRQTGLMHRDSMPQDHGMIFVFANDIPLSFWMKNTRLPLDILFVNSQGSIVSLHTMKPYDETLTPSEKPAKWAIELNEGIIAKLGLKKGDKLDIPAAARDSSQ
jgi:uncharacterized protein